MRREASPAPLLIIIKSGSPKTDFFLIKLSVGHDMAWLALILMKIVGLYSSRFPLLNQRSPAGWIPHDKVKLIYPPMIVYPPGLLASTRNGSSFPHTCYYTYTQAREPTRRVFIFIWPMAWQHQNWCTFICLWIKHVRSSHFPLSNRQVNYPTTKLYTHLVYYAILADWLVA